MNGLMMRIGSADLAITALQANRTATASPSPAQGDDTARPDGPVRSAGPTNAPSAAPGVGYSQSPLSADVIAAVQGQNQAAGNSPSEEDAAGADGLTPDEEEIVNDLQQRDAEVRRHEQSHAAAGGQYAGAPTYEYERGPDGQFYAVGGEVRIDTSAIPGDPEATIAKMQQVRRAAMAPAEPSSQDRRVATEAQQAIVTARAELQQAEAEGNSEDANPAGADADPVERSTPAPASAESGASQDNASRALAAIQAFQQTFALR